MENMMSKKNIEGHGEVPFVSVLVLSYNYGHLLGKALEACAAQTFRDFEIVMIDNGSTDSTKQVYTDFCEKHPEIQTEYVFVTPNQGPANGWNEGLRHARGEYVMLHDADDWMDPDCLEKLTALAKETGSDRVTGQYREVLEDGRVVRVRVLSHKNHRVQIPMFQGVLFRRSVIEENSLYMPLIVSYDFWFIFKFACCEKNPGVFLYETLYNYYFNPDSTTMKISKWGEEKIYKEFVEPSFVTTSEILKEVNDKTLYEDILFEVTKGHYFPIILHSQAYLPRDRAMRLYKKSHDLMKEKLPDYWKNPMVWKPFRSYSVSASFMLMAMVVIDKLHLYFLLPFAARFYKTYSSSR